jgi:DMSO/TMAO reductase YedYZ heme-binding membrane subunit
MVKLLIDFIQFLYTLAPLFMALGVLTLLAVLLSKSIKRHATVYYIVFAIPFALVAIPFIGRLFGVQISIFNGIPFLGNITRDYIHAGTLGFPLLVIIMYMGALNPKYPIVKKLLSIRKELSILSGFPILTHSLIRVPGGFPRALNWFFDSEAGGNVASPLGAGISNFSLVLGIVLLALFLPLWITSFDSVHKRMGGIKWKKLQRWSYVLYVLLFIHAMGLQVGGLLNPRGGRTAPAAAVEATAETATVAETVTLATVAETARNHARRENPEGQGSVEKGRRGNRNEVQPATGSNNDGNRAESARPAGRGGHQQSPGFSDITVSSQTKRYIHIASLLLIFGSYLYLRMRKARLKKQ